MANGQNANEELKGSGLNPSLVQNVVKCLDYEDSMGLANQKGSRPIPSRSWAMFVGQVNSKAPK